MEKKPCNYVINLSNSLVEIKKVLRGYLFNYKITDLCNNKHTKLIKLVYSPATDVIIAYFNEPNLAEYIKNRIDLNNPLMERIKKVDIDYINDELVGLEICIHDSRKIELNQRHKIKTLAI